LGCTADLQRVHTPDLLEPDGFARRRLPRRMTAGRNLPITTKDSWKLYSSLHPLSSLTDYERTTVASAPDPRAKDQFILVDLGVRCTIREITQVHPENSAYPHRFRIDVADDHNFPYYLVHVGPGSADASIALLTRATTCRFLRITLLEPTDEPWTVAELEIE
jgi:hypothetical protein